MFSTCIFCHSDLGANETVEHFPVGRRLAFDAAKGRLWVVCRKCERWNLTPLEERWEAIEECERAFRATPLRLSTDNIGLARVREGLELIRIGKPLRPEMAAWRYGDQFGHRRRRFIMNRIGAGIAATGLVGVGMGAISVTSGAAFAAVFLAPEAALVYAKWHHTHRVRTHVPIPGHGSLATLRPHQLRRAAIVSVGPGEWGLRLVFEVSQNESERDTAVVESAIQPDAGAREIQGAPHTLSTREVWSALARDRPTLGGARQDIAILTGLDALRAAGQLLPAINSAGAGRRQIKAAVQLIGDVADPSRLFQRYANFEMPTVPRRRSAVAHEKLSGRIADLPLEARLALEMSTHEETERRAMEGELALLEAAWRQAEEIAAIADDMFVPQSARARLAELKET